MLSELGIDHQLGEQLLLEHFSYVTEDFAPEMLLDMNDRKMFLADRYGSPGQVCNGGSARCGLNGQFQVKGNGTNPLVAINVDEGHSTGKLPLSEAVSEAIWSEICHNELPYGALRVIAVIKTSINIDIENTFGNRTKQPCALMVREVAARPAHFEPALHFWPKQEYAELRNAAHAVSFNAIQTLENHINDQNNTEFPLFESSKVFLIRFARQIAASRIKGIPHGSLTSSNIALDGRFLDLGTISAVGDFSNVILTSGLGATWDDHHGIVTWLHNHFYYLDKNSKSGLPRDKRLELIELFLRELERSENIYTAQQCNIPDDQPNIETIGKKIKNHLRKNKLHVSRLTDFKEQEFKNDLNFILNELGFSQSDPVFKYRQQKYSRFSIFAHPYLEGECGSREQVESLINDYIT